MSKLQIAIEELELHQRLRTDSRNWEIINSAIDEALNIIKEEQAPIDFYKAFEEASAKAGKETSKLKRR